MAQVNTENIGHSIGQALVHVCRAHRNKAAELLARVDLHPGQEFLLYNLWPGDGLPQSELTERLGVQPATLTRMLDRMEKAGYVVRRPDEQDQRVSRVYLTPAGQALEAPVCAVWSDLETATVATLSAEERADLHRLLSKVAAGLA